MHRANWKMEASTISYMHPNDLTWKMAGFFLGTNISYILSKDNVKDEFPFPLV